MKRVTFGIFLILSVFVFPWWVPFLLSILGLFYFDNLYEVIVVGLGIDVLYGVRFEVLGFDLFFTIVMLAIFYLVTVFKRQIIL
jgi:hypothetical protein